MLQNPIFWLLFVMMSMMSTSGLMVASNVGPFANEYRVAEVLVLGHGGAAAVADAVARDQRPDAAVLRLGVRPHRPRDHDGARLLARSVAILVLFAFIDQPALFVVLTGLVFFGWGEIFSLFPSTLTDTFGPKFAATNYGFLYIAQGVGSILGGPAAAFLKQTHRQLDRGVHRRRGPRRGDRAPGDHRAAQPCGSEHLRAGLKAVGPRRGLTPRRLSP